jgi:hypothetical protein
MHDLSEALTPALRESLVAPTKLLMTHETYQQFEMEQAKKFSPVLPLIMGGDDLFVLLPARWALDFAARFARAYEQKMKVVTKDIFGAEVTKDIFGAESDFSISAAVIICKATYPYYLAHQRGEALLKKAKQMGKRWGIENNAPARSSVTFEVILGNRISEDDGPKNENRPTLKPYWVHDAPEKWGLSLQTLLDQRHRLARLPRKRLIQFRALFDEMPSDQPSTDEKTKRYKDWQDRLEKLLKRISLREIQGEKAKDALEVLGGKSLYPVQRASDSKPWWGHGLPDLIEAWNYAFDLHRTLSDYEGED